MWSCDQSLLTLIFLWSYHNLNFIWIRPKKHCFEGWSRFKFNNLGLAIGMGLKFYNRKLKTKIQNVLETNSNVLEVTGKKLVRWGVLFPPIHNRLMIYKWSKIRAYAFWVSINEKQSWKFIGKNRSPIFLEL